MITLLALTGLRTEPSLTGVSEIVSGSLMYVSLRLHFRVFVQAVNFMDENDEFYARIDFVSLHDCRVQLVERFHVVILGAAEDFL